MAKTAIKPTRSENYPDWYQQVVKEADLAENSPVRGCMVIKPWGYAIWERIQRDLDDRIKETGHENAYFPLLIPLRYLEKEAEHVEGFAKECAVVTHHRLKSEDGKLVPDGQLDEALIIRPTSETVIGEMYAKWIQSYRDLPVLINQWANVMRWEMRTRLFLRTSEFLWQEGHTAHATKAEALEETKKMIDVYEEFAREFLAIPVFKGEKTPDERFPGAINSYCIEAMMQDGKALQAGTSHFLGQNFAKASEIKFQSKEGKEEFVWTTSWGVSTRLIGALIMSHSDDNGLVLPPRVAPKQIVIVPVYKGDDHSAVDQFIDDLLSQIKQIRAFGEKIRITVDRRDLRGGEKNWQHIKKGVPLKVEIGPRDVEQGKVCLVKRNEEGLPKHFLEKDEFIENLSKYLEDMQGEIYEKALNFRNASTKDCHDLKSLEDFFKKDKGFLSVSWCEEAIDHPLCDQLKISPRCQIGEPKNEQCIFSGKKATHQVLFGKSY